jgi:large subunit ribosomal protein L1
MSRHKSKKYQKLRDSVPRGPLEIKAAIAALKGFESAKFDESVDLAINLGVNTKGGEQNVRGNVSLPHGTGKNVRVLALAQGDQARQAQEAGADFVGDEDMIEKIQGGWLDFDKVVATPDMMSKVSKVARTLGPRGLMPNPKLGTVTQDVATAVKQQKRGMVEYKTDKGGVIHSTIGKKSFSVEALVENFESLFQAVVRSKPASVKGDYIKSIYLSTTMSPSVEVNKGQLS